ncbi:MAG: diguanylate cyclase [Fervidobacterium sp.]
MSFGVAQYIPGDTTDSLLLRVDQALYKAKQKGRNRVEID